jgi:hypothetical protein
MVVTRLNIQANQIYISPVYHPGTLWTQSTEPKASISMATVREIYASTMVVGKSFVHANLAHMSTLARDSVKNN